MVYPSSSYQFKSKINTIRESLHNPGGAHDDILDSGQKHLFKQPLFIDFEIVAIIVYWAAAREYKKMHLG